MCGWISKKGGGLMHLGNCKKNFTNVVETCVVVVEGGGVTFILLLFLPFSLQFPPNKTGGGGLMQIFICCVGKNSFKLSWAGVSVLVH